MIYLRDLAWPLLILTLLMFTSCSKDIDPNSEQEEMEEQNVQGEFEAFACANLNSTGDYSFSCISPNPLFSLNMNNMIQEDCAFVVGGQDGSITITTSIKNSVNVAENEMEAFDDFWALNFGFQKISSESISNLGDEARLLQYSLDNEVENMYLVLRKSNATIYLLTGYELADEKPCIHDKDELVKIAGEFLKNF